MSDKLTECRVAGMILAGDLWRRLGGTAAHFDGPNAFIITNSPGDLDARLTGGCRGGI